MNKNCNLITRNWKLLAFMALMAFVGCKDYEYENVIESVSSQDDKNFTFKITDTKTGVKRIYNYTGRRGMYGDYYDSNLRYLASGDTVFMCYGGLYNRDYYQNHLVLNGDMILKYNPTLVLAREEQERFNQECAKFDEEKSKMLKKNTDQGLEK